MEGRKMVDTRKEESHKQKDRRIKVGQGQEDKEFLRHIFGLECIKPSRTSENRKLYGRVGELNRDGQSRLFLGADQLRGSINRRGRLRRVRIGRGNLRWQKDQRKLIDIFLGFNELIIEEISIIFNCIRCTH